MFNNSFSPILKMKFQIKDDVFSTNVTNVDLSEREVYYIVMLVSGVQDEKIKELLNIKYSEIEILYEKFRLTNKELEICN